MYITAPPVNYSTYLFYLLYMRLSTCY